jgi:hypothetical protein
VTCCVLIVQATTSPLVPQVTPAWLAQVAGAINTQLIRDVLPIYGGTLGVRVGASPTDIGAGEMVFSLVDALPQDPGAIAYHSVVGQDVPFAFLALSTCSTLDDVSTGISHEMCETAGDLACNLWADDYQGGEWARELCDAVEANSYRISGVAVSDFLLPSFWGTGGVAPYTYCQANNLPGSFPSGAFQTASGGYQIRRAATGAETEVQGAVRPMRAGKVAHWSSRPYRRGVR